MLWLKSLRTSDKDRRPAAMDIVMAVLNFLFEAYLVYSSEDSALFFVELRKYTSKQKFSFVGSKPEYHESIEYKS